MNESHIEKLDKKYPFIRKYARYMGSFDYYTESQLRRAEETNAPENAYCEKYDSNGRTGVWLTIEGSEKWAQ